MLLTRRTASESTIAIAVLALLAMRPASASAATVTVTDAGDSSNLCATTGTGTCTLRDAITYANAHSGSTIAFDILGAGVHTITPATSYPMITAPVTIDGFTQPGSSANTNGAGLADNSVHRIEINGTNTGGGGSYGCLTVYIGGGPSTVRGLVVNRCPGSGIALVSSGGGNTIEGNYIGTDPTGAVGRPVGGAGVDLEEISTVFHENGDFIGGPAPAARNVLAEGGLAGVNLAGGTGHTVRNNLIGTNAAGTAALPNGSGVAVNVASSVVGGTSASDRNVISGNSNRGIFMSNSLGNPAVTNNLIEGNFIGTDVTGTLALGNGTFGVGVYGIGNFIGGSAPGAGNVISANGSGGIDIQGGTDTVVQGNFIGTDLTGTNRLGNHGPAVSISASGVVVGGPASGEANVIAFSTGLYASGVNGYAGTGNTIRGNSIHDNAVLGIDLGNDGVTVNDPCDVDGGPNLKQNFPLIISATPMSPSGTHIVGLLNGTASTTFTVDFYANPVCLPHPQDFLEGMTYLGSTTVTTDGGCEASIDVTLTPTITSGQPVTATATDSNGNTSEFSQRIVLSSAPKSGPAAGGTALTLSGFDFLSGASVTVGGLPATGVAVDSYTQITANAPGLLAGHLNDITVTNLDGTTGTLRNGFVSDFLDVSGGAFYPFVTQLVANDITAGCGSGNYCPNDSVTRAQMAVFLLRGRYGLCFVPPPATGTVFADVPAGSFAAAWIEYLATAGVTAGCGGGNYCPTSPVTRAQMAVFLLKTLNGASYVPPACTTPAFTDVPCSSPFAPWIDELVTLGITAGCGGGHYCPTTSNTRAQMAVFISKTFNLP